MSEKGRGRGASKLSTEGANATVWIYFMKQNFNPDVICVSPIHGTQNSQKSS